MNQPYSVNTILKVVISSHTTPDTKTHPHASHTDGLAYDFLTNLHNFVTFLEIFYIDQSISKLILIVFGDCKPQINVQRSLVCVLKHT